MVLGRRNGEEKTTEKQHDDRRGKGRHHLGGLEQLTKPRFSLVGSHEPEPLVGEQQQLQHDDQHRGSEDRDGLQDPAESGQHENGHDPLLDDGDPLQRDPVGRDQQDGEAQQQWQNNLVIDGHYCLQDRE